MKHSSPRGATLHFVSKALPLTKHTQTVWLKPQSSIRMSGMGMAGNEDENENENEHLLLIFHNTVCHFGLSV